jgi:hypothetical protein
MHREYRPLAEARGYALEAVWQTRPTGAVDSGTEAVVAAVDVIVEWRLPGVRQFFRSRAGSHDPATTRWWAETDALALGRYRSVLGPLP